MRLLRNSLGIGLMEVLMGAGLLGGLSLMLMKMTESGNQNVGKIEKNIEIVNFDQEINSYLSNSDACINSFGAGIPAASITGASQKDFTVIKNKTNVTVLTVPAQRGNIKLLRVWVTNYNSTTGLADFNKEFEYRVSPKEIKKKTKNAKLSISVTGTDVTGCVFHGGGNDGPWVVEPDHIYYDQGKVGIGTSNPNTVLEVTTSNAGERPIISTFISNSLFFGGSFLTRGARGTPTSLLPVKLDDGLGYFGSQGYDGTSYGPSSAPTGFMVTATEDWSATKKGSKLSFLTTNNNTNNAVARMVIEDAGYVGINLADPDAWLDIYGSMEISLPNTGVRLVTQGSTIANAGHKGWLMRNNAESGPYNTIPNSIGFEFWNGVSVSHNIIMYPNGNFRANGTIMAGMPGSMGATGPPML